MLQWVLASTNKNIDWVLTWTEQNKIFHTTLNCRINSNISSFSSFIRCNSCSCRNILIIFELLLRWVMLETNNSSLIIRSLVCSLPSCISYLSYRYFKWCFRFEGVNNHRMMRSVLRKLATLRKTVRTKDLRQNALRTHRFSNKKCSLIDDIWTMTASTA